MSAIEQLPDELLSYIQSFTSGSNIDRKFVTAQVSRRWRRVALASPRLWSLFSLSSKLDCMRLLRVLELTGPCVFLDVAIPASFPTQSTASLGAAMNVLIHYAARIRSLALDTTQNLDALLNSRLDFPVLHTLRLSSDSIDDDTELNLDLTAANLRLLDLTYVSPRNLVALLSERLVTIYIDLCPNLQYTDLLMLLSRCPNLSTLRFQTDQTDLYQAYRSIDTRWCITPLRQLQILDLQLPLPEIIHVVDNIVDRNTALPTVIASLAWGQNLDVVRRLCASLLRGIGPIRVFVMHDDRNISLYDHKGHLRRMTVWNPQSSWERVWPHLAESYNAQATIHIIRMAVSCWDELADDFAAYPPDACLCLRLMIDYNDVEHLQAPSRRVPNGPAYQPLKIPSLIRVEFAIPDDCTPSFEVPARHLLRLLESLACDFENYVEVIVEKRLSNAEDLRAGIEADGHGHRFTVLSNETYDF